MYRIETEGKRKQDAFYWGQVWEVIIPLVGSGGMHAKLSFLSWSWRREMKQGMLQPRRAPYHEWLSTTRTEDGARKTWQLRFGLNDRDRRGSWGWHRNQPSSLGYENVWWFRGKKKKPTKSEIKRLHLPATCLVSQLLWQQSLISILSTFSLISTILPQFPSTKLSCKNIVTKKHLWSIQGD